MIKFSIITSRAGLACKKIFLDAEGQLQKENSAQIWKGWIGVEEVDNLRAFVEIREDAEARQTFAYGIPRNGKEKQSLSIGTRTRANFDV